MKNLGAILTEAGSSWEKVVKTTILLVRREYYLAWVLAEQLAVAAASAPAVARLRSLCLHRRDALASTPLFPVTTSTTRSICSCICPQVDMNDFAAVNAVYGKVRLQGPVAGCQALPPALSGCTCCLPTLVAGPTLPTGR